MGATAVYNSMGIDLPEGRWFSVQGCRIQPLKRNELNIFHKLVLWRSRILGKTKNDFNLLTTLPRLGAAYFPLMLFGANMLGKGKLSRIDKERVILRVAWRTGAVYEWAHHSLMCKRDLGMSEEEIRSYAMEDSPSWDSRLRTIMAAIDEMVSSQLLSEMNAEALRRYLTDGEFVEFSMLVGNYVMYAITINTLGVQVEGNYPAL